MILLEVRKLLPICVASACALQAANARPQIRVGVNVQVSKDHEANDHMEVIGATDPNHPERLIACYMFKGGKGSEYSTAASVSFDGGRTWSTTLEEKISGWPEEPRSLDPTCTYGPDSAAYFAAVFGISLEAGTVFFRSSDGGRNWSPPVTLYGAWDRPYIAIDTTGSKYNGRIYVNHSYSVPDFETPLSSYDGASVAKGMGMQRSLDGGRTFLGPVTRLGLIGPHHEFINPGNSVVLSDGTVASLFFEFDGLRRGKYIYHDADGSLKVLFSRDGGVSYSDAVKVADHFEGRSLDWGVGTIPNLAVDPGSPTFKDRLYVVWHDTKQRHEEGLVSYSTDKGKSWAQPARFSDLRLPQDDASGPTEFQTTVAVNKEGVVGVMWYEGVDSLDRGDYWVRFTASLDGGDTWLPSIRVSDAPNTLGGNEKWALQGGSSRPTDGNPMSFWIQRSIWQSSGHTAGLAADANGVFHGFWIDNRTGIRQVWTAPIGVMGPVMKNGAKELADLEDVSEKVSVEVGDVAFDQSTNKLSATLRIKNTSKETISGPIKMRVLNLRSELCSPQVMDAENGSVGSGAILDFTRNLPGGVLKPSEVSTEKRLDFRLVGFNKSFRSNGMWIQSLVRFEAREFGRSRSDATIVRSQ